MTLADNPECGWESVEEPFISTIPVEECNSSTVDDAGDQKALFDITEYLHLPQAVVSVRLGMP